MGLEIMGASYLEYTDEHDPINILGECEQEDHWKVHHEDFPSHHADLAVGCYAVTSASEFASVHVKSHLDYAWWRDQLSRFALNAPSTTVIAHPEAFRGKPFYELIHFTDRFGIIGPAVCAKLARDFAEHDGAAKHFAEERLVPNRYFPDPEVARTTSPELFAFSGKWWLERYLEFKQAFVLGVQSGMVRFW